ncbi:PP2C family protein-serine/threonine phosphatase [Actinoplanes rectilineatus]|uniref:PP2C family protein-serine/threonine phosphatase n=1 Tax=Actinoplanes rectilineatus TaxID=113571 RepID=UPI0009FB22B2|nr:PP2C family protein-serine/threonine phosphatase [Actinoplanes rectilineatus]
MPEPAAVTDAATLSGPDAVALLDRLLEVIAERPGGTGPLLERLDRAAALALQRSLLPARLPEVPGVELAARYVPGHRAGIGGDWYDVFTLPSGWLGVVIGDVAGHGLASAVVMGRVRSALRAYALVCDDPAEALTLLDRKVQHFEAGNLTTALYVMVSPDRGRAVVSSAGHLRPVLAVPGRAAGLTEVAVDPPLGVGRPDRARHNSEIPLPRGAVLLCYTDGLVERRDEIIDEGVGRLVTAVHATGAEAVCATVMADTDLARPTDDVALLAVRRRP